MMENQLLAKGLPRSVRSASPLRYSFLLFRSGETVYALDSLHRAGALQKDRAGARTPSIISFATSFLGPRLAYSHQLPCRFLLGLHLP